MSYRYEELVDIHLPVRCDVVVNVIAALRTEYAANELVIKEQHYPDQRDGGPDPDPNIIIIAKRTKT